MKKLYQHQYYLDFIFALTQKEIKARYKRALFGFLWIFLNPLLQMLIIGTIFSFFIDIPNYYLFLFAGLLPWQFFSLSLSKATSSIVYERSLLLKAKFPKEAIIISIILANFIHLIVSILLLIPVYIYHYSPSLPQLMLLLPTLLWLLSLTIGLSLITASLNVRYRDINFFTQSAILLWFYATPILYSLSSIPQHMRFIFQLNPLTSIFELSRYSFGHQGLIDVSMIGINLATTIVIIVVGVIVFKRESPLFVDWL
jgi:lipopolysaccharide transport system permease protein